MLELLRKRRSIRKFRKRPVEERVRRVLEEALLRSPSSRDIKPWQFIFIDDAAMLKRLSQCKDHGAEFLANAALCIVVCADESKSDVWVEDCSIAAVLAQMAALEAGLGSCWIQVRNRMIGNIGSEEYIRNVLGIDGPVRVECIVALGYPAEKKNPVPAQSLRSEKIIRYMPPKRGRR